MANYKREYYFAGSVREEVIPTDRVIWNHLEYSEHSQSVPLEIQLARLSDLFAALADHLNVDVTKLIPEYQINGRHTKIDEPDTD